MPLVNEAEAREKLIKKLGAMVIEISDAHSTYQWAYSKTDMSEFIKKKMISVGIELRGLVRLVEAENIRLRDKNDCGD